MFSWFSLAATAEAAIVGLPFCSPATTRIDTIICKVSAYIIDPLIALLMALGLFIFIWGGVEFLLNQTGGEEAKIASGKRHMIWGMIGLLAMVSVYGFMGLIARTFNLKNSKNVPIEKLIPKSQNLGKQVQ
jgi:hypothetical protein